MAQEAAGVTARAGQTGEAAQRVQTGRIAPAQRPVGAGTAAAPGSASCPASGPAPGRRWRPARWLLWTLGLAVLMWGFLRHSVWLGLWGLTNDLTGLSSFYAGEAPVVTFVMFLHMITGALLIVLAVLQLLNPVRQRWPRFHRWSGRVMVVIGLFTAAGGILYALDRGTTGGPLMDAASTLYGVLMLTAAVQTYRFGRARRFAAHRRWGWRFSVLAIASWLYRMHYVVWEALTGGWGVTPDMTGPFDRFQAWAFYLSYAFALELWFLWEGRRKGRARGPVPAPNAAPPGTTQAPGQVAAQVAARPVSA